MKKILKIALKNTFIIYLFVVIVDSIFYTFSFIFTGILKRDIFNKLEGIGNFININIFILVALSALTPLIINFIKQLNSYLVASTQQNISNNLKEYIFNVIYKIPINKKIGVNSGEIIIRFREDVMDIVNFFMEIYIQLPKLLLSIVALIIMFKISGFFSVVSVAPLLLTMFLIRFLQENLVKNREKSRNSTDNSTEFLSDIFTAIDTVKLSNKSEKYFQHYENLCIVRAKHSIKEMFFQNLLTIFSSNLMYFALGTILLFVNNSIQSGTFSIGDFVLFEYYFWFLSDLPTVFSSVYSKYKQMSVAIKRIQYFETLNSNTDKEDSTKFNNNIQGIVVDWNLKKINIYKDELCIIRGKTGSGKSLFLKNIFSNNKKEGEITWIIDDKYEKNRAIKPPTICYLSQNTSLITDTIKNNICMGLEYDEDKINNILDIVDLLREFEQEKLELNTYIGNNGAQLSGGQIKRLALARLLYRDPQVILLDDITSGLDLITEKKIIKNLKKLKNKIIIISSNNTEINGDIDIVI